MTIFRAFWGGECDDHEYRDPGPNDLRGPCPFVNTLANHGYINRDGRYISWWAATCAIRKVYNLSWFVSGFLSSSGWWTGIALGWNPFWFDLGQLRAHKSYLVESDASLSRGNWPGNNWAPDEALVKELLDMASSPGGLGHEGFARHRVEQEAKLRYKFNYIRNVIGTGNCGVIIPAIGRGSDIPEERKISPDWVKYFFVEGRFPPDWTKQKQVVTIGEVYAAATIVGDDMAKIRAGTKAE